MNRRDTILLKIMARVEADGSCMIWQGPTSGSKGRGAGYPRMSLSGHTVAVHRVVYTHFYGMIPGRKQIDHICRNRLCLNPEHLEMVTPKENCRRRDLALDDEGRNR